MRNADLSIDEDDAEDLLKEIEKSLKMRQWGEVIKFEYEERMDSRLEKYLKKQFKKVHPCDMYAFNGPLDLTFLMKCYGIEGFSDLKKNHILRRKIKSFVQIKIYLPASERAMCYCIIHMKASIRLWHLSGRQQKIKTCLQSSRLFTVSVGIPRLSLHWHRQRKWEAGNCIGRVKGTI